jgi:hypothetical protein
MCNSFDVCHHFDCQVIFSFHGVAFKIKCSETCLNRTCLNRSSVRLTFVYGIHRCFI